MTTTNYYDTFIAVADDSPAFAAEEPPVRDQKTAARIEYEMVATNPFKFTSDDVLYAANGERRGLSRDEFFSKGQPCFRSSPLTQRYGWGVKSDKQGRIAIFAVESPEYQEFLADGSLKQLKALRSKRA